MRHLRAASETRWVRAGLRSGPSGKAKGQDVIVQLAILSAVLQALGYILYTRLFLKKVIRPNAASSFMFAYGTALLVLLEASDGASWPMLALPATCAFMSIFIAMLCLRKGATEKVDKVEAVAFSADVWLTALWAAIAFGFGDISPYSAGFLLAAIALTPGEGGAIARIRRVLLGQAPVQASA